MLSKTLEAELLALKDAALAASARGDGDFFADYLADDAIAITPAGVADRDAVVAAARHRGFQSLDVRDTRAMALGPDAGVVTYVARFARPEGGAADVFVTTLYCRDADGHWRGRLYQQTPIPG